jgi:hypothetical protein
MALPSSGQITIGDIANEFGGSAPHSLSEYYRGGGLVPDSAANAGVPTSGAISLSHFYGATAFNYGSTLPSSIVAYGRTFDLSPSGEAWAVCWFGLDDAEGRFFLYGSPDAHTVYPGFDNTWLTGDGGPSDYEVMYELLGGALEVGGGPNGSPPDEWINLADNPVFVVHATWSAVHAYAIGILHIRPAGGGDTLASTEMELSAFFDA